MGAGLLFAACAGARTEHQGVPLVWLADQESPVATNVSLPPHRLKLAPLVDRRAEPRVIGVNMKKPSEPLQVTTNDDVAAWATDRFAFVLRRQGVDLVDAGATVTLEIEIVKLQVVEAGFFNGEVEFAVSAKDSKGAALWRGALAGRSKRWGRTNNLQNYYEALTNAFEAAARKLASNPEFVEALRRS